MYDYDQSRSIKIIGQKIGIGRKESTEIVEHVFEIFQEALESGEKFKISGFGNFNIRTKRPRKGRNPNTGEEIVITERKVVTFKSAMCCGKL